MMRELGVAKRFFGAAQRLMIDPMEAASPVTSVVTGEVIIFTWSQIAIPASTDPPGELMTKRIGFPGSISSKYQILRMASLAVAISTASQKKMRLALSRAS